jgi:tRNA (cmo5U34)-methyltransferase
MKKSNLDQFNWIADAYDPLARSVLGRSITESQKCFLQDVLPGSKILILGGGTGWLLETLQSVAGTGEVWYIEASSAMLRHSQRKKIRDLKVHFIHGTEENIPNDILFDVVITNFYLDLFDEVSLRRVVQKIKKNIQTGALWLATDFTHINSVWHKVLLVVMYGFFKITTGIQAQSLPQWESVLQQNDMVTKKENVFYRGFIKSKVLCYAPAT